MNIDVFWEVTTYDFLERQKDFGDTCHLHLQKIFNSRRRVKHRFQLTTLRQQKEASRMVRTMKLEASTILSTFISFNSSTGVSHEV
jgi:hypothetical protein